MMRIAGRASAVLLGVAMMGTASCDSATFSIARQQEFELEWNRNRWATSGVRSYAYLLDVDCQTCPPAQDRPVEVVITDGVLTSARYYDDGTAADLALFDDYATVEAQFELIGDALARRANSVAVLYETRYALGHPESVILDYSGFRNDDEISFFVLTEMDILD